MSSPNPSPSQRAQEFVAAVLRLRPQIAVFDCDGTLWPADSGEQFFYWEIEHGLLPEKVVRWALPRYQDYKACRVSEEEMCGEMVTLHSGLSHSMLERAATEFFEERIAADIFPEMLELTRALAAQRCQLWAVSSTNDWVVRAAAPRFSIPPQRVIAACVEIAGGCATDRLIRVPTDELKAAAIRELLPRSPDAAFGNSLHDLAMLEMAQHAFIVNPNPDLEEIARQRGWTVYQPANLAADQRR